MSDFPRGSWESVWDGLFWCFVADYRGMLSRIPRFNMTIQLLDRMEPARREELRAETKHCWPDNNGQAQNTSPSGSG